jgi:hypothetical protein
MPSKKETYSLAERAALANGDLVTFFNTESRGNVSGQVLVALLVTVVLGDVVEVFTADNESTVHLGGHNGTGQDTTTDGDETGEGALLVCRDAVSIAASEERGFHESWWVRGGS